MCYEPLRFSPIFRRFVNSRESRVGLPLTPLNLTTKSVCALAQSSLFCGVCLIALRSLAHSHKQHPPLCVFYTHSLPNKTPLSSRAQPRGWKSPRGDFTKTNSRTASGCRSHAYSPLSDISRSSSTLEGVHRAVLLSSSLVFVSLSLSVSSLSLVVCLGDDNASSVVGRNNERARASLPRSSLLAPSRRVCVLSSHLSSERQGARSLVLFGCLSSNYGDPTKNILVSRSVD